MQNYIASCEEEVRIDWWDEYIQALEYIRRDEV
jgi:hypothetical protein